MNSSTSKKSAFDLGKYSTKLIEVEEKNCKKSAFSSSSPKPLLIATPLEDGVFPVLILLHGYLLYNSFYSQLIQHIASHGFIVVAPQLYSIAGPNVSGEIIATAEIINWLPEGLSQLLPTNVLPNLTKLGLAGHSRGGKVAFASSLHKPSATSLHISALIGVDPVDGMDVGKQTQPPILTYIPNSFDFDNTAVLVIGSGLGEVPRNRLFPPCAPNGVNHKDFYNECCKPAYYFVAKDYGHLDMLDGDTKGIRGKSTYCLCKNGKCREPMRRFVGGIVVVFLKAYLEGDETELLSVRDGRHEDLPVDLQRVEYKV